MKEIEKAINTLDGKLFELVLEFRICKSEAQKNRINREYKNLMAARDLLEQQKIKENKMHETT